MNCSTERRLFLDLAERCIRVRWGQTRVHWHRNRLDGHIQGHLRHRWPHPIWSSARGRQGLLHGRDLRPSGIWSGRDLRRLLRVRCRGVQHGHCILETAYRAQLCGMNHGWQDVFE